MQELEYDFILLTVGNEEFLFGMIDLLQVNLNAKQAGVEIVAISGNRRTLILKDEGFIIKNCGRDGTLICSDHDGQISFEDVGDVINVDNGAIIHFGHWFNQLEYNSDNLNAFVAGSISHTRYQREDRYNYLTNIKSDIVIKWGYDFNSISIPA